ncbi:uncharacterized protein PITG_11825 [Phytophthora infestans T30-4]|uniref:RNase H type-1 domain-containing protein n=1 Tax=Phytophthora infestans (strain T30-4) TaxID=403677 RepID=D0NHW8_PHYIT|nr:uncharacterized protein PITG_11825 [Phytophthora infestans T30-4]EEY58843.1 hypothetical protein PITG_11825 [Phytophthora infestans T30-4]|eukprot:XP_002901316.1 hypothetical protein PITG_11825 [Phytophthora infestans T30-4]
MTIGSSDTHLPAHTTLDIHCTQSSVNASTTLVSAPVQTVSSSSGSTFVSRIARRLADQGQVTVWKHHYRKYNKAADWLANYAMDTGKSVIYGASEEEQGHELRLKVEHWATGDVQEWQRGRNTEGEA